MSPTLRIPAKKLKYRNTPTTLGGLRFASKAEAKRYGQLLLLLRAGVINDITVQPRFPLVINEQKICQYVGDFSYHKDGVLVVEDVKSPATKTTSYKIKKKLLKAIYGIDVSEIGT